MITRYHIDQYSEMEYGLSNYTEHSIEPGFSGSRILGDQSITITLSRSE